MATMRQPLEGKIYVLDRWSPASPWVILFQSNTTPDNDTEFADLTEADFSGYSRLHPSWTAAANNGTGDAERHPTTASSFAHNGGGTANTIYGFAICPDNAGLVSKLLCVQRFAAPVTMDDASDVLEFTPKLLQGQYPIT